MFVISNNNNGEAPFRVESDLTIQEASHIQDFTLWKKTETNKLQLSQMYRQLSDSTSGWNEHLGVTQLLWLPESFSMLRAVANLENSASGASVSLENKKMLQLFRRCLPGAWHAFQAVVTPVTPAPLRNLTLDQVKQL